MCEAGYAAEIDECTVVDKALDRAANRLASFERGEDFLFLLSALSFEERTAGKNEALLVDIDLDDLSLDRLADIDGEILDEVEFHLGCRDEAAQTLDGGNEAALDNLRDVSLNRLASFLLLLHLRPSDHAVSFYLGEDAAVVAAEGNNVDVDDIADFDDIFSGLRSRISQLALRDSDLLLVSNIDISLVAVYLDDLTFYSGALLDIRQGLLC